MFKLMIKGVVQGVGFRPYIYNACKQAGLLGYVQNVGEGVVVEVNDKDALLEILKHIPPLARIDSIDILPSLKKFKDFIIKDSEGQGFCEIPPDLYLCGKCLDELRDPSNRRYGYFFITCTNCGPRFSITLNLPYDRRTTTLQDFDMCERCEKEYKNPYDRRCHAQTIACHDCGPELFLGRRKGSDAIKRAAELIAKGQIVAIKGIGGFHLSCNTKISTIARLKEITGRKHKPFALMCKDIEMVRKIARVSAKEEELLKSVARPIVILEKKESLFAVSELSTVGVILPYTATHYLLFDYLKEPIVMTSSNISGEPITILKDQQFVKEVLYHTRAIENPVEDSLVKVIKDIPMFLRRSRGFVPRSIPVERSCRKDILALGAELNSAFCVYTKNRAFISQYLGDTSGFASFERYKNTLENFLDFTKTNPSVILADMHPSYNTSVYAKELSVRFGAPLLQVQHHKAHAYSAAGERNAKDFAAIVCDGLGYGEDGSLLGGEVFVNDERAGHLEDQYLLGGDSAARFPAKMLFSILRKFLPLKETKKHIRGFFDWRQLKVIGRQYDEKFNCPLTSSCGRVLDAASFLLGFCDERTYEGRSAMLLEANSKEPYYLKPVIKGNILMTTPLFGFLVENFGKDRARLAATVQEYIIEGLYSIASKYKKPLFFSGGCAYNRIMAEYILERGGHVNEKVPCGDGGISFGQVAYYLRRES